jgi:hypothetical protein
MGYTENRGKLSFLSALAWVVSFLFHPMLMPTLLFGVLLLFSPVVFSPITEEGRNALLLVVFISTCLLPLLIILSMFLLRKRQASLKDFIMAGREDRIIPFLFTGLYYLALTHLIFSNFNRMLYVLMLAIAVLVLVLAVITVFWKVSAHAMAMGGFLGLMLCLAYLFPTEQFLPAVIILILISGIVMTSRLFLGSHIVSQVFGGYAIGLVISMASVYVSLAF